MTLGFDKRFSIAGRSRLLAGAASGEGAETSPDFPPDGGLDARAILCVDMDAFFASVEQQCASGTLDGQAVMVCGNTERRSVVAAANYVAREYGVRAGTPITTARRLCPGGVFLEGDPEKYVYTCIRINDVCRGFTPRVETFSIDESFLDVTGTMHLFGGPREVGRKLKARIRGELGIACTVGIAPNKLLAKTASKLGKPDGLFVLTFDRLADAFHPLPVDDLYGIGAQTAGKLKLLGVETIGDLARIPADVLQRIFGIIGPMLRDAANGIDHSPLLTDDEQPEAKSVGNSYTLADDTRRPRKVLAVLLGLCSKVGRRMRKDGHAGRTVTLTVRYDNFQTIVRARTVAAHINLDRDIFHAASDILADVWDRRRAVRLLGVSLSKLVHHGQPRQQALFGSDYRRRYRQALASADELRDRYGETVVTWGSLVRTREVI